MPKLSPPNERPALARQHTTTSGMASTATMMPRRATSPGSPRSSASRSFKSARRCVMDPPSGTTTRPRGLRRVQAMQPGASRDTDGAVDEEHAELGQDVEDATVAQD